MDVGILCQFNQARSPLGALALTRLFPSHNFWSAGISPQPGSQVSKLAIDVARNWGLILPRIHCKSLNDVFEKIRDSELIISTNSESLRVVEELGFRGDFQSIDNLNVHKDFVPQDPIGMSLDKAEQEFAKFIYCLANITNEYLNINSNFSTTSIVPLTESDCSLAYYLALFEIQNSETVLIDVDFRAPGAKIYLNDADITEYDPFEDDISQLIQSKSTKVFTPKREFNTPIRTLLDNKFQANLQRVAKMTDIILVTSPRYIKQRRLPDSYIASISSQQVKVISA